MLNSYKLYFTFFLFFTPLSFKAQDTLPNNKTWLHFNLQGSFIANKSLSNLNFKFLYPESAGQNSGYTKNSNTPVCYGFNAGLEFLLGHDTIKHIISLSYDLTNSNFNNYTLNDGIPTHTQSQKWHENIRRQVQFISINYGISFNIIKKLKFAPIACLNYMYKRTDITNGYYVESLFPRLGNPGYYDSTTFHNSKVSSIGNSNGGFVLSLKLRLSYDVTKYLSIYVARNFGLSYIAPWWMLGVQYYPFKKWR
ncbi:MAG: hypothetical protein ABI388_02295 [Bacteroidia bacterium]